MSGQTLLLPGLSDGSEWVWASCLKKSKMIKGDGGRNGWVIGQVPEGTVQRVPRALVWPQNHEHRSLGTEIGTCSSDVGVWDSSTSPVAPSQSGSPTG